MMALPSLNNILQFSCEDLAHLLDFLPWVSDVYCCYFKLFRLFSESFTCFLAADIQQFDFFSMLILYPITSLKTHIRSFEYSIIHTQSCLLQTTIFFFANPFAFYFFFMLYCTARTSSAKQRSGHPYLFPTSERKVLIFLQITLYQMKEVPFYCQSKCFVFREWVLNFSAVFQILFSFFIFVLTIILVKFYMCLLFPPNPYLQSLAPFILVILAHHKLLKRSGSLNQGDLENLTWLVQDLERCY